MSPESSQGKIKALLVFLGICALVINGIFLAQNTARQERVRVEAARAAATERASQENAAIESARLRADQKQRKEAQDAEAAKKEAKRQAEAEAAEAHARFVARHVNSGFTRRQGIEAMALSVASEDGKPNLTVAAALSERLRTNGIEITSTVLKPEFVSDGLINDAFTGSSELAAKLELANTLDAFLLARQSVSYSSNPNLLDTLTANMRLEVAVMPIGTDVAAKQWTFIASGIGFTRAEARAVAEDHLLTMIKTDSKMSLR